jgi:hypothetical protein
MSHTVHCYTASFPRSASLSGDGLTESGSFRGSARIGIVLHADPRGCDVHDIMIPFEFAWPQTRCSIKRYIVFIVSSCSVDITTICVCNVVFWWFRPFDIGAVYVTIIKSRYKQSPCLLFTSDVWSCCVVFHVCHHHCLFIDFMVVFDIKVIHRVHFWCGEGLMGDLAQMAT